MQLRVWLSQNKVSAKEFARDAGCSANHMLLVKNDRIKPSMQLANRIEVLTGGEVTTEELRGKNV